MAKKLVLMFFVALVAAGGVFAQNEERAKNAVAVQFGIIGVGLSYERMFNRHFSVLADATYTNLAIVDEFTISGKGRVYPFGGAFYLEMGAGFAYGRSFSNFIGTMMLGMITFGWYFTQIDEDTFARTGGLLLQPGLGWKIDIGKKDGFVLPISLGLDIKAGSRPDILPYLRIGLGYAF